VVAEVLAFATSRGRTRIIVIDRVLPRAFCGLRGAVTAGPSLPGVLRAAGVSTGSPRTSDGGNR
jgi:hypothetical protein